MPLLRNRYREGQARGSELLYDPSMSGEEREAAKAEHDARKCRTVRSMGGLRSRQTEREARGGRAR